MSIGDIRARDEAEQAQIDVLERELREFLEAGINLAAGECRRVAEMLRRARGLVGDLDAED